MSYHVYGTTELCGFGATASSVLDYMREVNDAALSLDEDIRLRPAPMAGQAFFGPWFDFLDGVMSPPEAPPVGWKAWFQSNSSLATRIVSTESLFTRTGEYERRLIELYDEWVKLGGKPSRPRPEPGMVEPETPMKPEDKISMFVTTALFIGTVVGIGYLIRSVK